MSQSEMRRLECSNFKHMPAIRATLALAGFRGSRARTAGVAWQVTRCPDGKSASNEGDEVQLEKAIENQILNYLKSRRIFAHKVKTVGTYDPKIKRFRASSGMYMKGVADIIGIFNHRFLAIEVKSAKGTLTLDQRVYLQSVLDNGGIAFVARSVEDVEEKLKHWGFNTPGKG